MPKRGYGGRSRTVLLILLCLFACDASASSRIFGTIRYRGEIPIPKRKPVFVDQKTCGSEAVTDEVVLGEYGELPDAVVSLMGPMTSTSQPFSKKEVVIDQKNCRFTPRVVVVPVGADLVVKNSDGLSHALRTVSRANPVMIRNQQNTEARFRFQSPETVELRCDIHDWMSATVVVLDHPFYAVSDAHGHFSITNVPAGDYWIEVRHGKLGDRHKRIQVKESEDLKIDFRLEP
jgi:plastocyanin